MKRLLCSLLIVAVPSGGALADAPKSKNAKVTLVYQHELPNVPGKSIKGVLVEYGPGGYSPAHRHAESAFIYAIRDDPTGEVPATIAFWLRSMASVVSSWMDAK